MDFNLFRNTVFTGATISNFLINGTAGALTVSLWVLQGAAGMSAATAGYLTAGYAIFIIAFIRVGEKLLQRFGPRKPMLWGCLVVLASIVLLMATHTLQWQYTVLAVVAYSLFGLGLAFYATPSTDAALTNLPGEQAGAGSGIYKMASSLGAAFGENQVVGSIGIDPVVIALAIASGAMFALHVNSNFFWMFKALLGLSTKGSLKTLTLGTSRTRARR